MAGKNEFSSQTVMSRVFVVATNRLAVSNNGATGTGGNAPARSAQSVWNAVFDSVNNRLNM